MEEFDIKDDLKKKKSRKFLFSLLIILLVLGFILFENHGIFKRISLEKRRLDLNEKLALESKVQDSLAYLIRLLETDTLEIEKLARQRYGMKKQNEFLYIFKERIP